MGCQERQQAVGLGGDAVETSVGLRFLPVDGGTMTMGQRKPVRRVFVSSFYMAEHEVTQAQWLTVMGSNFHGLTFEGCDSCPVDHVSWYDAVCFCNALSVKEGKTPCYTIDSLNPDPNNMDVNDRLRWTVRCNFEADGFRLPTESEWEYAARGGTLSQGFDFAGSNRAEEVAWYKDNSQGRPQPVRGKRPNELGLYDLSGNVSEWCWDWHCPYDVESVNNPTGGQSSAVRVKRGGAFGTERNACLVVERGWMFPSDSKQGGIRPVCRK